MSKITKNQHFVPQCLLRNFTSESGVVNIYDSARKKLRNPTSVNRVLSENYFYDKDNIVENFLAEYVEGPASHIFKMIAGEVSDGSLDEKAHIDLLRFIIVQLSRTPRAFSSSMDNIDTVFSELIKQLGELNNFDEDVINSVKFSLNDPKDILRLQTLEAALDWPLLDDLKWHFLINDTDKEFVISDHPVVHYNWYLRNLDLMDVSSLAKCGLQVFLPVSSRVTLCLYDNKIYKIGDKNKHFSLVNDLCDIHLLNELQFRSRESFIVFSSRSDSNYVENQCQRFPSNSLYNNDFKSSPPVFNGNEAKSKFALWRRPNVFERWLSFCKVKNKISRQQVISYDRRPDIVRDHRQFKEHMRMNRKRTITNV
ncbi:DUF4238 domain-containing protein [Vibrio crassostreae]|nr:DUF4238 domain-containing protein [Vibrio crassostreae]